MTKLEIFKRLDLSNKKNYTKGELKSFINAISNQVEYKPIKLKKGDVFSKSIGVKKRPCVVIKVNKDMVYYIALSTTEDDINLCSYTSRFFGSGFFSKGIYIEHSQIVIDNFRGVFDNNIVLNKAIELMKQEIKEL